MAITNTENQDFSLKENIRKIYSISKECPETRRCPIKDVLAPSVDKWSLFCLYNLAYNKTLRFNKLKGFIPDISSRMLSVTLKKLESAELINRKIFAEVPPRVEYSLTDFGLEFAKRLVELNLWIHDQTTNSKNILEKVK